MRRGEGAVAVQRAIVKDAAEIGEGAAVGNAGITDDKNAVLK
jgi:hypothetical protein